MIIAAQSASIDVETTQPTSFSRSHLYHHNNCSLRIRSLSSNPMETTTTSRHQQEEDIRHLFETLRAYSTLMPKQLAAVNGEATEFVASWRDAAAFQGYRHKKVGGNWGTAASNSAAGAVEPDFEEEEEDDEEDFPRESVMDTETVLENLSLAGQGVDPTEEDLPPSTMVVVEPTPDQSEQLKEMEAQLNAAIKNREIDLSIDLFEAATVVHNVEFSIEVLFALFHRLSYQHPFHAYQILQHILQRTNTVIFSHLEKDKQAARSKSELDDKQLAWLYQRMCFSLRTLDPTGIRHKDIRSLAASVISELNQLNGAIQRQCLPHLVTSLVMQKSAKIGQWAHHYYTKMSNMALPLSPRYFLTLVAHSRYNRSDNIPFYDAVRQTVLGGLRPFPHIVIGAVENMFPYTANVKGTYIALESIMELQRQTPQLVSKHEEEIAKIQSRMAQLHAEGNTKEFQELREHLRSMRPPHSYIMDITSLEHIADAAAKKNFVELTLLVWDALDLMDLEATEPLYESTIMCFAKNLNLVENCFAVMNDMEQRYTPSQAFVSGFAAALR